MHGGLETSASLEKLQRRLERERRARIEAEEIAERGLRDLYTRKEELKLLQRIATAANATSEIADALALAIREVSEFAGWPVGHAYLAGSSGSLEPRSIWHVEDGSLDSFRAITEVMAFEAGIGLPGRVLATGAPAWISDVAEDSNFPRAVEAVRCGLASAFAFPILVGSEVVAVLEFFSRVPQDLDGPLLNVMGQIGLQLGRVVERQRHADRLLYQASHDALTGLANRALFLDRLAHAADVHAADRSAAYAVLFIDIDRFKLVNDSLGHASGDTVILETAKRLQGALHTLPGSMVSTLARLGGDEFTVLLERISGPADAVRAAELAQNALEPPFLVEEQHLHVAASIGIACVCNETRKAADLLHDADLAMYRAKANGRGRIEVFDVSMHAQAVARLRLESDLRRAIARREFVLHYQPIVALNSSEIVGFEALVRWCRNGEIVYPSDFIAVAEETGLIIFLGEWVLQEASRSARRWSLSGKKLPVSVNISARHFAQPDFVDRIRAIIDEAQIDPALIRLELTESVTIVDAERTIEVLQELRNYGVRIAIDDFGTGYSSLSYLQKLPLDVLKIDRSFIMAMNSDPQSRKIVQTIMALAESLGMDVVAEGTETATHVLDLVTMGCQFAQGYYFSRPVDQFSADMLVTKLAEAPSRTVA